jgi:hypothetical protein
LQGQDISSNLITANDVMGRFFTLLFAAGLLGGGIGRDVPASPYQFSGSIRVAFERDTTRHRSDWAATAFSYIGAHAQALSYFDKAAPPPPALSAKDSLYTRSLKPQPARKYILQRARREQIIIFNEAHHNPAHRVFTASLLAGLYQAGFRYLGAETLSFYDSALNLRKYPVSESGYYIQEPQYGNLIREALELGFKVFPYDVLNSNGKAREIGQARHIQAILRQDPKARLLIHCGYSHVFEAPVGGDWEKAMAGRLKEFTGIDPFTIDQERWTEKSEKEKENPAYRLLDVKEPSVFTTPQGDVFSAFPGTQPLVDVRVAHPRTTYQHGRPAWLLREGKRKPYFLQKEQLAVGFPCLVLAYKATEPAGGRSTQPAAVPADVMELQDAKEHKALILAPGMYQVVVKNEQGQQQTFTIFN